MRFRRGIPVEPPARVKHSASERRGTKTAEARRYRTDGYWVKWDGYRRETWHPASVLIDIVD